MAALHNHRAASQIMDRFQSGTEGTATAEISYNFEAVARDASGIRHRVEKVKFNFKVTRRTGPIELKHSAWGNVPVAYGEGDTGFGKTFLVITEPGPNQIRGSLTFVDPESGDERVVEFGESAPEPANPDA